VFKKHGHCGLKMPQRQGICGQQSARKAPQKEIENRSPANRCLRDFQAALHRQRG